MYFYSFTLYFPWPFKPIMTHELIIMHYFGPHCSKLILLQKEDLRSIVMTQTNMLKNCYNTVESWEVGNQPCLSSILIIFLQSVDTLRNSTERVHLLCTKPNHWRLFMFTAPRQQNNETKNNSYVREETVRWCMFGNIVRIHFK